ncbi:putative ribonuclease H-like domain-containing protein [Tanacetum coccineum]
MTGNISYLSEYEPYDGGYVSFGYGGVERILVDDSHVLLRTPRQHNMYSIDLNNIVPHKNLTCLIAKASVDESMMWHRRLGHLNFKTMNKLVRNNLVRGLPSKSFENDHTCVACLKGKQHKASCKTKLVNSVSKPLHTLHMDLFGPTFVSSLNHKWYCLVVIDDFSRFTWTFFLKSKDETGSILRNLITEIENLKDLKVKIIRCDNGGEFKNREMDEFCIKKGEMANVLSSMGAANILASGGLKEVFTTASPPVPPVSLFVPTVAATASEKDSTAAVITTTTAVTPYTRRTRASRGVVMTSSSPIPINIPSISKEDKGKGIMTEPAKLTKQKVQEQMSEQLARELEEEFAQENQRLRE